MTQYPLRVPDYLMEQARAAAAEENVSINQLFLSFIAEGMGHRRALKMLQERASRGDAEKALAVLDGLTGLPPETGEELPFKEE
jgi:rubrerythrin